jgi:tRNA pseudouridine13 synthase
MLCINRYTDFLVNEVLPSGKVLHLQSILPPPSKTDKTTTGSEPKTSSTSDTKPEAAILETAKTELQTENADKESDVAKETEGKEEKTHEVIVRYTTCLWCSDVI